MWKKELDKNADASVLSFRFNLSDGTSYELIYTESSVKNGTLCSNLEKENYFTRANIGWLWSNLNKELITEQANESELPKLKTN